MGEETRNGIQVIARAGAVLRSLEKEPSGLSLSEIAVRVGLPRSTVQRIVDALLAERFLMAASRKARVKLGPALVKLGAAADAGTEKTVRTFMVELAALADETVDLSILRHDSAIFVDQVQGTQRLAAISAVGKEFPLHCTANGKALLALLEPSRRERYLAQPLKRYTDATVIGRAALANTLREVGKTRLAYDIEEHTKGICAVGVAFIDALGCEYSLSIPVPESRFHAKKQMLSRRLLQTKTAILERLAGTE